MFIAANHRFTKASRAQLVYGLGIVLTFSGTQAHQLDPSLPDELETIEVEDGRGKNLIGIAETASQGEVSQKQFEYRPLSRNGELIEVVPGAVATQHSGSGKANQYFLRGFNLDHGTDCHQQCKTDPLMTI